MCNCCIYICKCCINIYKCCIYIYATVVHICATIVYICVTVAHICAMYNHIYSILRFVHHWQKNMGVCHQKQFKLKNTVASKNMGHQKVGDHHIFWCLLFTFWYPLFIIFFGHLSIFRCPATFWCSILFIFNNKRGLGQNLL